MGCVVVANVQNEQDTQNQTFKVPMWYWQEDSWETKEKTIWRRYQDIESAIIEEVYEERNGPKVANLDKYYIDLNEYAQISRRNPTKQWKVKRELCIRADLVRETNRFVDSQSTAGPFYDVPTAGGYHGFIKAWKARNEHRSDNESLELAACGIIFEAVRDGKDSYQAEWLANSLRKAKDSSIENISITCIKLYTMESFLYKMINDALRDNDQSRVETLGPFCYLLFQTHYDKSLDKHQLWGVVYRGTVLDDAMIEKCKASVGEWKCWYNFASTSRNRALAEEFANTLFIIDIKLARGGLSLEKYSMYEMEKEVLLPAGVPLRIDQVEYDNEKQKHLIYVTAKTRDTACKSLQLP
ncbi:unnamed protein product [Rotaria sp. Silwood2]|nr:unnamed protein product [Rotaria sp. Silwood2]CAF2937835.1 unnamed protein product [Rotaria sp. Silwood2]CAF4130789.1 unnamed protein product [Rotaria sp. Silwood2]CAF4353207.1 unnamed protein product [Rotaria sp. Silwood2]